MNNQYWSWILTAVGLTGFILAGRKVWWCWYVNIACQALWFVYAIVTAQYGFIVAALAYTVVFSQNAIKWTREHRVVGTLPSNFHFLDDSIFPGWCNRCGHTVEFHREMNNCASFHGDEPCKPGDNHPGAM